MKHVSLLPVCLILSVLSCNTITDHNLLERALASQDERIKRVMDSISQYEVQIRYTQIDRITDSVVFTNFDFQVNDSTYFYPASTVKFAAAVAALEKLNQLDSLDRNTRFYVEGDSVNTTFSRTIQEIFAVSDNAANNRLVEFLGQDELNARMQERGVSPIRISHRLSTTHTDDITTKPLVVYTNDSTTVTSTPLVSKEHQTLFLENIEKGIGLYADDVLHHLPFDFGLKNYFPIKAQHGLLTRIIFPDAFPINERFDLSLEQHQFLLDAMHTLPKDTGYDQKEYYDSYGKFLLYGDSTEPMPDHMEIYNKVGYAYGTLTDCAYIKDTKNEVEFMVVATILVNKNRIFNDDTYEYDSIGIPFLAQLGRELYALERERN